MSIQVRTARYAGYRTRELVVAGDGPTCLLLHGFGQPADCWRPVLNRIAWTGRSAVAVDLPGFGIADDTHRGPRLPQLDAFVDDVVTRHGADVPVTLVGNSLGGLLAVRAASRALPIGGVVPLAAAGFGWGPVIRFGSIGGLRPIAVLAGLPIPQVIHGVMVDLIAQRLIYGDPASYDAALAKELTAMLRQRSVVRRLMRAGIAYVGEVSTHQRISGVTCPVTVVHGGRDRLVSLTASRRLHGFLPGSTLVVLERAGHCPQLDAPDAVSEMVLEVHTKAKEASA